MKNVISGSRMELRIKPLVFTSWRRQSNGLYRILLLLVFALLTKCHDVAASASDPRKITVDGMLQQLSNWVRIQTTSAQYTTAFRPTTDAIIQSSSGSSSSSCNSSDRSNRRNSLQKDALVQTVSSVKIKQNKAKERIRNFLEFTGINGFYYGIDTEKMIPKGRTRKPRPPKLQDSMVLALEELKMLRLEMEGMRTEIQQLKRKMIGDDDESSFYTDQHASPEAKAKALRKRRKEAEKLAAEIESWAIEMIEEGEEDGWVPVECSKMIRASMNRMGRTTAFMKWMVDSRAEKADKEDQAKHPCIKCSSTIDAPLELVCTYLSQPEACSNYNDVVDKFEDLEEISPNAKICWSSSPQILFVKPRDFVTFCHHRWKSDGTEVIVNQACEHPKFPLKKMEKEGKSCRGYALRGANFLSRCSEDPSKTKITIIAHCRPGGGLPDWATKTAVKALAPIEPFKLFHKINDQVMRNEDRLRKLVEEANEAEATSPPGRTSRPGGFAQIGYACFWPKGGGKEEQAGLLSSEQSLDNVSEDRDDVSPVGEVQNED